MKVLLRSLVLSGLLALGSSLYAQDAVVISKASPTVMKLIEKYKLQEVKYDYVKDAIGKGSRNSTKALLIDARPELKYKKGTIPSSINIPDTKFDEYFVQLKDTPKDKEIIVFCGGFKCAKSAKVAGMLQKKGFKNVKVYSAGEPQWNKKSYLEVDTIVIKTAVENNSALIVDARPFKKYQQETILGALSVPDTEIDKLIGRFPINKDEKIIVFCGGYNCAKSHNIAKKLIKVGYKNVNVYAAGLPGWKSEKLVTTKSSGASTKVSVKEKSSKNGLKLGSDEGTVDGEWFKKLLLDDKVPSFVQIVDVTAPNEYSAGHLKGAINIEAAKLNAKELLAKLPKGKTIVFNCTAGGRSTEAWSKLNDEKYDMSEIYYFDANIDCKGTNCKIEPNEPLE